MSDEPTRSEAATVGAASETTTRRRVEVAA